MRSRASDFLCLAVLVGCIGCRVPYDVADVRGPVRSVHVLDAETARDLPGATASFQCARFPAAGSWPRGTPNGYLATPALTAGFRGPDRLGSVEPLARLPDGSFPLPYRLGTSFFQFMPFVVMDGPSNMEAGAIVTVSAPGHYAAECGLHQMQPGWNAIQAVPRKFSVSGVTDDAADPDDMIEEAYGKLEGDGTLLLYLRKEPVAANRRNTSSYCRPMDRISNRRELTPVTSMRIST